MTLDELKKLCEEATPGPWWTSSACVESSQVNVADCFTGLSDRDMPEVEANATFIAAAREALPKLIAVAEAARGCLEKPPEGITAEVALSYWHERNRQYLKQALAALESPDARS